MWDFSYLKSAEKNEEWVLVLAHPEDCSDISESDETIYPKLFTGGEKLTLLLRASPLLQPVWEGNWQPSWRVCGEKHLRDQSAEPWVSLNLFSTVWGRRSPSASKQVKEASQERLEHTQKNGSPGGSGTRTVVCTQLKGASSVSWT